MRRPGVLSLLLLCAPLAGATCWGEAAQRYRIPAIELAAHACVESSMRPAAVNRSHLARTGSVDLGLMQINSSHLDALASEGITRERLLKDACLNLMVGARILAENKSRYGDSWIATGAYNASCTKLQGEDCTRARSRYAWRVYRAMQRLQASGRC